MATNTSTFVISVTCFDKDDKFDVAAQRAHFRRLVAAGIGVYVGGGGSGEAYNLSTEEYRHLIQVAQEELKGKVPFRVMGVEPRSAKEMVALYGLVKPFAPDALQIYSLDVGHSGKPMNQELEIYFRDVLEQVPMPCVISSHQSVGYNVPVPTLKKLVADYPQVVGINATCSDVRYIAELAAEIKTVELHVGGPMQALQAFALGGHGYLSSEGNLVPKLCMSVINDYKAGDMPRLFSDYALLLQIFRHNSQAASIAGVKAAMQVLGLPGGGYTRKPRMPVSEARLAEIKKWIRELRIVEVEGLHAPAMSA